MSYVNRWFWVGLLLFSFNLKAQTLIEEKYEGFSQQTSPIKARQDILKEATKATSLKYIKQIIGEARVQSHSEVIQKKILRQFGKYILFMKGHGLKPKEDGYTMSVNMKVSTKNLREILLSEGLLYKVDGPPKVIPMVSFVDKVNGARLSWWAETQSSNAYLYEYSRGFSRPLKKQLMEMGFYLVSPLKYRLQSALPHILRMENPRGEDCRDVAIFFGGAMVIRGQVEVVNSPGEPHTFQLNIRLEGIHSSNGRIIGEVVRTYQTETGPFHQVVSKKLLQVYSDVTQGLVVQLRESWKQGTFGASLVKLSLNGSLNYHQLKQFKKLLIQQIGDVKQVRERLFEPSRITLELDLDTSPRELANSLQKGDFPRFEIEVAHVGANQVDLNISGL